MANITQEDLGNLKALVTIELEQNDYQSKVDHVIKDYSKQVNLKGFRKGKVPPGVIKKMYGNQILAEELNKIVIAEMEKYLEENNIKILGQPIPKQDHPVRYDINTLNPYQFAYELGLSPEFEIKMLSKKPSITKHEVTIDDDLIDQELMQMRLRYGKMTNPEDAVQENDILYVSIEELDNGDLKEGGQVNHTAIPVDMFKDKKAHKKAMGMKIGDHLDLDGVKVFEKDIKEIGQHFFEIKEEEVLDQLSPECRITLEKINRREPAALDQDFFDKIYGLKVVTSEDEMKARIGEEMQPYIEQQTETYLRKSMHKEVLDKTPIDLPDDFLKRWIKLSNEKPISDEDIEKDYDSFARNLKWTLIVNQLAKSENITVSQEELKNRTKEMVRQQLAYYGQQETDEAEIDAMSEQFLKREDHLKKTYDQLLEDKIFDYLKTIFKLKPKKISYTAFAKLD